MPPPERTRPMTNWRTQKGNEHTDDIAHAMASQMKPAMATRRDGWRSKRPEHLAAERRVDGIGRNVTPDEIACDLRVGQLQKLLEGRAFFVGGVGVLLAKV